MFNRGDASKTFQGASHDFVTEFLLGNFATPEFYHESDFVAIQEDFFDPVEFDLEVVFGHKGFKVNLLCLLGSCLAGPFLLAFLVFELRELDQFDDRRLGRFGHFDDVDTQIFGLGESL